MKGTTLNFSENCLDGGGHYIPLYVFTPFLRKIVFNSTRNELLLLILISFFISALNNFISGFYGWESKLFCNWFLLYIPFYLTGYFINTDPRSFSCSYLFFLFSISILLTAFGCHFLAQKFNLATGLYFYNNLSITVIPMSISIMYLFRLLQKPIWDAKYLETISICTFGAYLSHPIFLELINYLGFQPARFYPLFSIFLQSIIVFILSVFLTMIFQKIPFLKNTV